MPLSQNISMKAPIVVILGATGTGKSKLSLEIAQKFNGEIISADSMQVYKGLDIITNKVTQEEQKLAKHHLLDFVDPLHEYTIHEFRDQAVSTITDLHSRGRLPVIVGGTHYYIESVLWKVLIDKHNTKTIDTTNRNSLSKPFVESTGSVDGESKSVSNDEPSGRSEDCSPGTMQQRYSKDMPDSTEGLYDELKRVDPQRASELHPNDRRKIIRSLEVSEQSGVCYSTLLQQQREQEGGNVLGGGLRYPNTIVLWLTCQQDVLDKRLNDRVSDMMERGLLSEMIEFHEQYNRSRLAAAVDSHVVLSAAGKRGSFEGSVGEGSDCKKMRLTETCSEGVATAEELPVCEESKEPGSGCKRGTVKPYTRGIFQSIGFKEFHEYLILPEEEKQSENGNKLIQIGVQTLQQVTRKYARQQLKWIKARFTKLLGREVPAMFDLDTTDVSQWGSTVSAPALAVVEALLQGAPPPLQPVRKTAAGQEETTGRFERHVCTDCDRVFIGLHQWNLHINGNIHKRGVKKKAKRELILQASGAKHPSHVQELNNESIIKKNTHEKLQDLQTSLVDTQKPAALLQKE